MIVSLLVFFQTMLPSDDMIHSAAPTSRIIHNQRPVQMQTIPRREQWNGHFSAQKFENTARDRVELLTIKKNIRLAFANLPNEHTQKLENLEIRNMSHRSRGMANSHKIIMHTKSIDNDDEMIAVFIHEMGHIVDLGLLRGHEGDPTPFKDGRYNVLTDDPSWYFYRLSWENTTTRKKTVSEKDFVSGYAMSNSFEDFAESYIFYRLHGEKFRAQMKDSLILQQKYRFMKEFVFGGEEFQKDVIVSTSSKSIWDTTLLAFNSF